MHFIRKHLESLKRYSTILSPPSNDYEIDFILSSAIHVVRYIYLLFYIKTNHQSILTLKKYYKHWTITEFYFTNNACIKFRNINSIIIHIITIYIDSKKDEFFNIFSSISQSYWYYAETATSRHIPASKAWLTNFTVFINKKKCKHSICK